jgi:hypothetical protein
VRGYGLPRYDDVENPDVADIRLYGSLQKNIAMRILRKSIKSRRRECQNQ